jgi:hypothetical protein
MRLQTWVFVIAILLSFSASFFIPFLHTDEGCWATMSRYALSGDLYTAAVDIKPPFLFQFFWLSSAAAKSMIVLHAMTAFWLLMTALIFFKILEEYLDRQQAFFAALLFACLSGVVNYSAYCPERAYMLFLALSFWCARHAIRADAPRAQMGYAFLVGMCVGAATGIKQPALLIAPVTSWFLFERGILKGFLLNVIAGLGLAVFTYVSWKATGVDFQKIWFEAYEVNFGYIKFHPSAGEYWRAVRDNVGVVLLVGYLPVTLGSLVFLAQLKKHLRARLFNAMGVVIWTLGTFAAVGLGGRMYQNYLIVLLPLFAFFTAVSIPWNTGLRKALLVMSFGIAFGFSTFTLTRHLIDKNKNWDSQVHQVIEAVEKDTQPSDTIWMHHATPSIYFATHRTPATRFLVFMHVVGYVDACTANEDDIQENLSNPRYQLLLSDLDRNKPKVIFWVTRHINTCADRFALEKYPTIKAMIDRDYEMQWSNALGNYYKRKS